MGYAEDSGYNDKPKPKKTALVGKTTDKQKAYYHKQRLDAEAAEKKGSTKATRTAGAIHQKLGRKLTGAEGDLMLKPGASEGEQMTNLAMVGGALGDAGALLARGLGKAAVDSIAGRLPSGTRALSPTGRMALPSGEARSSLGPAMRRLKGSAARSEPKNVTPAAKSATKRLTPKKGARATARINTRAKTIRAKAKKKVPATA